MKGNRKTKQVETINGKVINNAVLNKCGIPQLSDNMSFLTLGSSGSVKDRSNVERKTETVQ